MLCCLLAFLLLCPAGQAAFPRDLNLTGRAFLEAYAREAGKLDAPVAAMRNGSPQAVLDGILASWYPLDDGLALILFRRGVSPRLLGVGLAFQEEKVPQEDWKRSVRAVVASLTPRLGDKYRNMLNEELISALRHRQAYCSYRTYAEQRQFVVWSDWEEYSAALFVWPEVMRPSGLYWLP